MRIGLAQINPSLGNKAKNLEKIAQYTAFAANDSNCDLVVFPELTLTGYLCHDDIFSLAEPISGEATNNVGELAKDFGIDIVFGLPEKDGKILCNTALYLSGKDGSILGHYRKHFLPNYSVFNERRYFRQGNSFPVFQTAHGRIGLCICYDVLYPEIGRILSLKGAEIMICLSNSPGRKGAIHLFESLLKVQSLANNLFTVFVNRVGIEESLIFWGGSQIFKPNGRLIAKAKYEAEDFVSADIDINEVERYARFLPFVRKDLDESIVENFVLAWKESQSNPKNQ